MTDIFMIHRAAGTAEAQLRFQLMKARNALAIKEMEFSELAKCHDELVDAYLKEGAVQREREKERNVLVEKSERLDQIERAVGEQIAPIMAHAFLLLKMLNRHIEKWSGECERGVPYMPIEPGMAEAIKELSDQISEHVVVVDRDKAESLMANLSELA